MCLIGVVKPQVEWSALKVSHALIDAECPAIDYMKGGAGSTAKSTAEHLGDTVWAENFASDVARTAPLETASDSRWPSVVCLAKVEGPAVAPVTANPLPDHPSAATRSRDILSSTARIFSEPEDSPVREQNYEHKSCRTCLSSFT